jgi:hypothetical protein
MIICKRNEPNLARIINFLESYLRTHYLNIVILNFSPSKYGMHFVLDFCFGHHATKFSPKKNSPPKRSKTFKLYMKKKNNKEFSNMDLDL